MCVQRQITDMETEEEVKLDQIALCKNKGNLTRNWPPRDTSLFSTALSIGSTADLFSSSTLAAFALGSSSK